MTGTDVSVLVVDDDEVTARMLARMLILTGLAATAACSAEEALQLLSAQPVGLVLTDLMVPEMDGLELIRRIRSCPVRGHVPVVALTAAPVLRQQALAAGATDVVTPAFAFASSSRLRGRCRTTAPPLALGPEICTNPTHDHRSPQGEPCG